MSSVAIGVIAAIYFVLILLLLALKVRVDRLDSQVCRALEQESKWRHDEDDRLRQLFYALQGELQSGFEELGLEKVAARPALGPRWRKM